MTDRTLLRRGYNRLITSLCGVEWILNFKCFLHPPPLEKIVSNSPPLRRLTSLPDGSAIPGNHIHINLIRISELLLLVQWWTKYTIAAPTAIPANPLSVIGVSMTRLSPCFRHNPRLTCVEFFHRVNKKYPYEKSVTNFLFMSYRLKQHCIWN